MQPVTEWATLRAMTNVDWANASTAEMFKMLREKNFLSAAFSRRNLKMPNCKPERAYLALSSSFSIRQAARCPQSGGRGFKTSSARFISDDSVYIECHPTEVVRDCCAHTANYPLLCANVLV